MRNIINNSDIKKNDLIRKDYVTKALEIYKTAYGEEYPDYATSLSNLSLYLSQIGDYAKAIEYATKSVEIDKAIF